MESIFEKLYSINVNDRTEEKNGLTYLSWAWAWAEFKKVYPEATYTIKRNEQGLPYIYDENLGYMVFTEVTAGDLTHEMWLPVMDNANKTMKNKPYTYQAKEYNYGKWTGKYVDKAVEPATMFDINKAIMRCLVKNLAMFGLGLYIYAGEDLPEEQQKEIEPKVEDKSKTETEEKIGEKDISILKNTAVKHNKSEEQIANILIKYGYANFNEVKKKDYMKIGNELCK